MTLDSKKKILCLILIAIGLSFIAIGIAQNQTSDIGFEVIVNNTNLAPTFSGEPPGTGERLGDNNTYWANESALELFVFGHANVQNDALHLSLYINGTQTEHVELRPLGAAERTHAYVTAIIPKFSNYSVNITNYHHYEWREYQILSGRNGTLSINQTILSGANESQLNLKVNKSGDEMSGDLNMTDNDITQVKTIGKNTIGGSETLIGFVDSTDPIITHSTNKDPENYSLFYQRWNEHYFLVTVKDNFTSELTLNGGFDYRLNSSQKMNINSSTTTINNTLDLNNNSIINCVNCGGSDNLSWITEKVNKSGDNITGSIDFGRKILQNISELNFFSHNYTDNLLGRYSSISFPYTQSGSTPPSMQFYFRTVSRVWNTSINDFSNGSNPEIVGSYDSLGNGNWQVGVFPPNSITKSLRIDYEYSTDIFHIRTGAFKIDTAGKGISIKEGTNAKQGTCTMVAGTCTISNTAITANSRLFYNYQAPCSANIGTLYEQTRNAGVNFTIKNTNAANTCSIAYEIFEPS